MRRAGRPFLFITCHELKEMLGRTAWDERELLDGIEEVPADSLYYHTLSYFLRSKYLASPYPNDFATWAAIQVRDRVLGERLAVVDPFDYEDIESLRSELITIIDDHLASLPTIPRVVYGEPFHFMRSTIIEIPTGIEARSLREFRDGVQAVDLGAIFYHFFGVVRRKNSRHVDPIVWLEEELDLPDLAGRIRRMNPYVSSLVGFRTRLLAVLDHVLEEVGDA
ncbi:MAG: DUF5752 family protein [Armatimonadota bacterium]|nr:DUF5752 family protein [Armatimonadota bacterium]